MSIAPEANFSNVRCMKSIFLKDFSLNFLASQTLPLNCHFSLLTCSNSIEYMDFFVKEFDTNLYVAGVIPFMLESGDAVDQEMYKQAQEIYGEHLIKNVVLKNARLKRYDGSGITMEKTKKGLLKQWDRKSHELFISILKELEEHENWYAEVE